MGNQIDCTLSHSQGLTLNAPQGTFPTSAQFKAERKERQILLAQVWVFADSSETWKFWTDLQVLKNGLSAESHIAR